MIIRTESVSFPRSGHSPLYNSMKRYFGDRLVYCDVQNSEGLNCGCRSVPCINPRNNFSKSHDWGLKKGNGLEIRAGQRYLVQYRNPVRSIASDYNLYVQRKPHKSGREEWHEFACEAIAYWNKLIDKWVIGLRDRDNPQLICPYEQLVQDPIGTVTGVVEFVTDEPVDGEALRREISQIRFRPLNRLPEFRHFDTGFFREIEAIAGERMTTLAIPSFEDGG